MNKNIIAATIIAGGLVITGGTATAASLITSAQIKDNTVQSVDIKDGTIRPRDLNGNALKSIQRGPKGDAGVAGVAGAPGAKGAKGDSGLLGAYYAVAKYDVGDTNGGAIATVGCSAVTDVAISGGVEVINPAKNVPVGTSRPGRMDWTTNTPKAGRLDGWIVQFASQNATAPEKVNVWALCVPGAIIPVTTTYVQSQ